MKRYSRNEKTQAMAVPVGAQGDGKKEHADESMNPGREGKTIKLKLNLQRTRIKRIVTLPADISLDDFNRIIQDLFGFERKHLWKFKDREGNAYSDGNAAIGYESNIMDKDYLLNPCDYTIADVLRKYGDVLRYVYNYAEDWKIVITRMTDPRDDQIACVETIGTNAIEEVDGIWGLGELTEALEIYEKEERAGKPHKDADRRIAKLGYDDAEKRKKFLAGPTKRGLTKLIRNEIDAIEERHRQCRDEAGRKRQRGE